MARPSDWDSWSVDRKRDWLENSYAGGDQGAGALYGDRFDPAPSSSQKYSMAGGFPHMAGSAFDTALAGNDDPYGLDDPDRKAERQQQERRDLFGEGHDLRWGAYEDAQAYGRDYQARAEADKGATLGLLQTGRDRFLGPDSAYGKNLDRLEMMSAPDYQAISMMAINPALNTATAAGAGFSQNARNSFAARGLGSSGDAATSDAYGGAISMRGRADVLGRREQANAELRQRAQGMYGDTINAGNRLGQGYDAMLADVQGRTPADPFAGSYPSWAMGIGAADMSQFPTEDPYQRQMLEASLEHLANSEDFFEDHLDRADQALDQSGQGWLESLLSGATAGYSMFGMPGALGGMGVGLLLDMLNGGGSGGGGDGGDWLSWLPGTSGYYG